MGRLTAAGPLTVATRRLTAARLFMLTLHSVHVDVTMSILGSHIAPFLKNVGGGAGKQIAGGPKDAVECMYSGKSKTALPRTVVSRPLVVRLG